MTNKYHNQKFYKLLKAATKDVSDRLYEFKSSKIKQYKGGGIDDVIANVPSFMSCVQFLMEDLSIERLKNIKIPVERRGEIRNNIVSYIKKYLGDPNLQITPWSSVTILDANEEGDHHVEESGCSIKGLFKVFNEQTFNDYYVEYEQFLYSNLPIKYHIVAALYNLYCDMDTPVITLSNKTRLIPDKESFYFNAVWQAEIMSDAYESGGYEPPGFWLEIDYEMQKEIVSSECKEHIVQVSFEEVQTVFKILRSYKEGDVRCGLIYWLPKTPCDSPYNYDDVLFEAGMYRSPNRYVLKKDDVNELQLRFQKYTNNSNKKDFPHSAIYYLDKGVRETDIHDRLVDYTAALESLFVNGKEGIATSLAYRTAFFLEKDRQKCKDIYKDIKKAYGFRSNIVHGDYHKIKDELVLKEYCNKIEGYVRLAIANWIDMVDKGMKRQEIHDSIEDNLFS